MTHKTPVVLAQRAVGEKTKKIPEARPLLEPLDLRGKVVTADAMHAQKDLAMATRRNLAIDLIKVYRVGRHERSVAQTNRTLIMNVEKILDLIGA